MRVSVKGEGRPVRVRCRSGPQRARTWLGLGLGLGLDPNPNPNADRVGSGLARVTPAEPRAQAQVHRRTRA